MIPRISYYFLLVNWVIMLLLWYHQSTKLINLTSYTSIIESYLNQCLDIRP